jgi:ABC-type branched-subunit amino acid transport system ATPase component/MFS family permease
VTDHLGEIHASERLVDSMVEERDALRAEARRVALGERPPHRGLTALGPAVALGTAVVAVAGGTDRFGSIAAPVTLVAVVVLLAASARFRRQTADTDRIRTLVGDSGASAGDPAPSVVELARRTLLVPSVRRVLVASVAVGALLAPLQAFLVFYLGHRWHEGSGGRLVFGLVIAAAGAVAAVGLRREAGIPERELRLAATLLAAAVVLIAVGVASPWFGPMAVLVVAGCAAVAALVPVLAGGQLAVVPAAMRAHLAVIGTLVSVGLGGLLGVAFLASMDRRAGAGGALATLLIPGLIGAAILWYAAPLSGPDLDRMLDAVLEEEEIGAIRRSGGHLPMLACRQIDFAYGQLQVLFDVNFTVDDGEMVALLGTNGAGKSTLLKAISGVGLPSGGTVRFRGADITYLEAERRIPLGITQVPGGRAVFGPLTVVENMRAYGHTVRRDRRSLNAAMDLCFETFPNLARRRNQPASTLSGGEQQMLGLSKALILRPQLLLIDELSLGLAPIIVGQLLELVRAINTRGTAVVLVEQSVNIALGLVDHAYFMEKGQVRFDGRSEDLLARGDLLRAVFLDGATKGLGS